MIDFSTLKDIIIPEGKVIELSIDGVKVWTQNTKNLYKGIVFQLINENNIESIAIIGYESTIDENLVIPSTFKNYEAYTVQSIQSNAFMGCAQLKTIVFPETLKTIEFMAFEECTNLTDVTIPANVESISPLAFHGCASLTTVTFENPNGWIHDLYDTQVDLSDPERNAEFFRFEQYGNLIRS